MAIRERIKYNYERAKDVDKDFKPENYEWILGVDVVKELVALSVLYKDAMSSHFKLIGIPVTVVYGRPTRIDLLRDVKTIPEPKEQPRPYYITTASRPNDDWVMQKMKEALNAQYGLGGYTYSEPKFDIDGREPEGMSMIPNMIKSAVVFPRHNGESLMKLRAHLAALDMIGDKTRKFKAPEIDRVIFNNPATIVFWKDGTKTVVKAQDECFDEEKGITMAIVKKVYGNEGNYYEKIKKHLPKIEKKPAKKSKSRKKSNKK